MPIVITIERILAKRKMRAKDLAETIGVSETHLSLFRSGKVRGVRFSTLARLCAALRCQPGDLLAYEFGEEDVAEEDDR